MDKPHIIFHGNGSSFSMTSLLQIMCERNYDCEYIDMTVQAEALARLRELQARRGNYIFVTTDHPFLDHTYMSRFAEYPFPNLSSLEIIHMLEPARCVIYPHDLITLFEWQDIMWLSVFDAILLPDHRFQHLAKIAPTHVVGWARMPTNFSWSSIRAKPQAGVIYITGLTSYEKRPVDDFIQRWEPLLTLGFAVKFPAWSTLDDYIKQLPSWIQVVPATENHYDIADQYEFVVVNAGSSLIGELGMAGCEVFNVEDDYVCPVDIGRQVIKPFIADTHCFSDAQLCADAIQQRMQAKQLTYRGPGTLKPLDYDKAIQWVLGAWA